MQRRLLGLLADGLMHSGNELAGQLSVSRAAISKQVQQLEAMGLVVAKQAGRGYQLAQALELLDSAAISAALANEARHTIDAIELLWVTNSTSDHLVQAGPVAPGSARVCLAEYQTGGRGRRGRQWLAPIGSGVCLSVAWTFQSSPGSLSCLGLAAGVGVLRAVRACGLERALLKWPNDVVVDDRKLAGILIDVQGEAGGPLRVVAGIGLNYSLSPAAEQAVLRSSGLAPTSMSAGGGDGIAGRNQVAACLINEIVKVLQQFGQSGFEPLLAEWSAADYLRGKQVVVATDDREIVGTAAGLSPDGQMLLDVDGRLQQVVTGDVRVRIAC